MIRKDFFNEGVILDVLVHGGNVSDSSIVAVDISYAEDKHDIATITYAGFPASSITAYVGLPVHISFGNNEANKKVFYGYVAYVDAGAYSRMGAVNKSLIQEAKVVCMGTSYDMKSVSNNAYKNVTIPKLVKTLARKHNFSYSVPNNDFVIPMVAQQNQSDWELLVSEANKFGYRVTATSSHINVYDPFSGYFHKQPITDLESPGNVAGKNRKPGSILEFKGTFGDVTPYGNSHHYDVNTLDKKGKTITSHTSSLSGTRLGKKVKNRFTHNISTQSPSKAHLNQMMKGYNLTSFPYYAEVTVSGVSTPTPGSLVLVKNYDSRFDGYWVVESIEHSINTDHYITKLCIKTDSTIDAAGTLINEPQYKKPPRSVLNQARWVTEKEMSYVY